MTPMQTQLDGCEYDDTSAIQVCGHRWGVGVPVFRWTDPRGFDGYTTKRVEVRQDDRRLGTVTKVIQGHRFSPRRPEAVRQFMVHHSGGDGADPRNMYETLWNNRNLSVHYAIEDDGRVWQFVDAQECCWHAGAHNGISVGAECCLFPLAKERPDFYSPARNAKTGNLPHQIVEDTIHGKRLQVFAFTEHQVESLARVIAGTWLGLYAATGRPQFLAPPAFPRDDNGTIPHAVVSEPLEHVGIIGHLQCTTNKIDPAGFPWAACEARVAAHFRAWKPRAQRPI